MVGNDVWCLTLDMRIPRNEHVRLARPATVRGALRSVHRRTQAWRYVGRRQNEKNRAATPGKPRNQYGGPKLGYAFVHTVIDDHSRVAYTEVHDDETAITAVAVLRRAVQWLAGHGVTIERVLSDNGGAYRSHLWRDTCHGLSITPKRTRPYRPQTNGKVERFHRTMADGWAYARCYTASKNAATRSSRGWGTTTKCDRIPRAVTSRHSPNSERLATLRWLRRPRRAAPQ